MHRSRIGVMLIDHPATSFEAAVSFWATATGAIAEPESGSADYTGIGQTGGLNVELQQLGDDSPPRVHLDIETDDVPAEVERLERLGAKVSEQRTGYTIMVDPGGLVFCVVPVQTGERFAEAATTWD